MTDGRKADQSLADGRIPLAVGLVRARSHIVFILGLVTAGAIIITTDQVTDQLETSSIAARRPAPPTAAEREAAAWAWAAASRSTNGGEIARARLLAKALGVRPETGPPPGALSPSGGLAALEDLATGGRRPTPAARAGEVPSH
jgi:hypothetical protein